MHVDARFPLPHLALACTEYAAQPQPLAATQCSPCPLLTAYRAARGMDSWDDDGDANVKAWEGNYERSWETVQEDASGQIMAAVAKQELEKTRKRRFVAGRAGQGAGARGRCPSAPLLTFARCSTGGNLTGTPEQLCGAACCACSCSLSTSRGR